MIINIILTVVLLGCFTLCYYWGKHDGEISGRSAGRLSGWQACENLLVLRMVQSDKLDLTEREILDEFIC